MLLLAISTDTSFQFRLLMAVGVFPCLFVAWVCAKSSWKERRDRGARLFWTRDCSVVEGAAPERDIEQMSDETISTTASTASSSAAELPDDDHRAQPLLIAGAGVPNIASHGGVGTTTAPAPEHDERENPLPSSSTPHHQQSGIFSPETRQYVPRLLGTGLTWFFFDIAYFGTSVFAPFILEKISPKASLTTVCFQTMISQVFGMAGTYFALVHVYVMGLKKGMTQGFIVQMSGFLLLAASVYFDFPPMIGFLAFCICQGCLCFGPNIAVFILPTAVYPEEVRSTFFGASCAGGKAGAFLGSLLFPFLVQPLGLGGLMLAMGGICLLGMVLSQKFIQDDRVAHVRR